MKLKNGDQAAVFAALLRILLIFQNQRINTVTGVWCARGPAPPPTARRERRKHTERKRASLPEHPSQEGSGGFDLFVGLGHQLHGLLLFAGVVHDEGRKKCSAVDGEEEDVSVGADAERLRLFVYEPAQGHPQLTATPCRRGGERPAQKIKQNIAWCVHDVMF